MAIVRRTTSVLGLSIVKSVEAFMNANSKASFNDKNVTPEEGAEQLSHLIAYAIAKSLGSPQVGAAFAAGI